MLIGVNHLTRIKSVARLWIGALASMLSACAPDMSGAYMARDETSILMLQVVVGADDRLSGTMHHVSLEANGRIKTFTASVAGVVSGGDLAMAIKPNGMLTTTTNLSATYKPGSISLTWVDSDQVSTSILRRRSMSEFTGYVEQLQQRGSTIRAERADQRRQDQARRAAEQRRRAITNLAAELERAGARHAQSLERVAQRNNGFKEASAQMDLWLSQWRNAPERSHVRGDLRYRIRSLNQDMSSAERDMTWSRNEFEDRSRTLLASVAEHQAHCQRNAGPACAGLTQAAQRHRTQSERLRSALAQADETIAAERAKRERIMAQLD